MQIAICRAIASERTIKNLRRAVIARRARSYLRCSVLIRRKPSVIRKCIALLTFVGFALTAHAADQRRTPGALANPGFEGQPMKSMFFFPGQWRGVVGEGFYAGPNPGAPPLAPATNAFCLYTVLPVDGWMNLGWSDNVGGEKRGHAVDLMLAAGVNVVNMSYWGPPNVDRWA